MATQPVVTKVWIEPGCIVCDACETTAPTVFEVTDDSCLIRPEALNASFTKPLTQAIIDAAQECPVDVIKYETVTEEVSPALADPGAPGPVALAPPKPVAAAPDPAIAALLRAATSRGGNALIQKNAESVSPAVETFQKKAPRDLPPDARQAKVQEAAKKISAQVDGKRREFLGNAALATGWIAFGAGLGVSCGPAFGRFMMPNVLEEPDPRVRVGKLQRYLEMAPGEVNEDYKPQGIWMIRDEERIAALSIICTHLGCIPNWLPNDRKFKCPCHGSGYKPSGINFEGPTPRPFERFRIFVEDGIVVVDKSKKYQFELGQWEQPGSFLAV